MHVRIVLQADAVWMTPIGSIIDIEATFYSTDGACHMRYSGAFQAKTDSLPALCILSPCCCRSERLAHVPLHASNVRLRSLKLLSTKLQMPGLGAVPIDGLQPFGSVSFCARLRGA